MVDNNYLTNNLTIFVCPAAAAHHSGGAVWKFN
jgi:hypothetical protein